MKIEKINDSTVSVNGVYYSTKPFTECASCALLDYCITIPSLCKTISSLTGISTTNKSFEKIDMETKETKEPKEVRISIPKGYEIDTNNSTFNCIKFKKISKWRDNKLAKISGYYIDVLNSDITEITGAFNDKYNSNIFATKKLAKSALAMARISQIIANDERFGGVITDKEWKRMYYKIYYY